MGKALLLLPSSAWKTDINMILLERCLWCLATLGETGALSEGE